MKNTKNKEFVNQVHLYESPQKQANEDFYGLLSHQCICCGKPMKENETFWVHMSTDWKAMHNSIIDEKDADINGLQSQGYFPIGNSCVKKMPKAYVHTQPFKTFEKR